MQSLSFPNIPCVILAGGKSQRLRIGERYKWSLPLGENQTLIQLCIQRLSKQIQPIIICGPENNSENRPLLDGLSKFQLPLIHDEYGSFQGPLAALLSCLKWAKENQHPWIATAACDTPFLPQNLFERLWNEKPSHYLASVPLYEEQLQPVMGLWSSDLYSQLYDIVIGEQKRGLVKWASDIAYPVSFSDNDSELRPLNPFMNINTPEDYGYACQYYADYMNNNLKNNIKEK